MVKPTSEILKHISLYSGNTILGDGAVVLILDPMGLARALGVQGVDEFSVAPAPAPLRTLAEIRADILALERQSEGLLHKIVGAV